MKLEYEGVLLRNAEAGDAGQLAAWWNDGKVMAHAGFPLGLGTTPESLWRDASAVTLASEESVEAADIFMTAMKNNFDVGRNIIDRILTEQF